MDSDKIKKIYEVFDIMIKNDVTLRDIAYVIGSHSPYHELDEVLSVISEGFDNRGKLKEKSENE